jgi:hypothetical protein
MNSERNNIYISHAELVSASNKTLKQVHDDKHKNKAFTNENVKSFIDDSGINYKRN